MQRTIRNSAGKWLYMPTTTSTGWTSNPHLSYLPPSQERAERTVLLIQESGRSPGPVTIMHRAEVEYIPAREIPEETRSQVPGHQVVDWETASIPRMKGQECFYPVMPPRELIAAMADDGWTRLDMPGEPDSLVFERPVAY